MGCSAREAIVLSQIKSQILGDHDPVDAPQQHDTAGPRTPIPYQLHHKAYEGWCPERDPKHREYAADDHRFADLPGEPNLRDFAHEPSMR